MGHKITISPVTRIEGHARVTIYLNEDGSMDRSFFHVDQFRGVEKFCEGRMFFEMVELTRRICGICPVSHHLAAAKACDAVVGATPPGLPACSGSSCIWARSSSPMGCFFPTLQART